MRKSPVAKRAREAPLRRHFRSDMASTSNDDGSDNNGDQCRGRGGQRHIDHDGWKALVHRLQKALELPPHWNPSAVCNGEKVPGFHRQFAFLEKSAGAAVGVGTAPAHIRSSSTIASSVSGRMRCGLRLRILIVGKLILRVAALLPRGNIHRRILVLATPEPCGRSRLPRLDDQQQSGMGERTFRKSAL